MYEVTSEEAKSRLNDLIEAALQGEMVFISQDDRHKVQLVPVPQVRRNRVAGSGKGTFTLREDFDEPLSDFDEYMR